MTQSISPGADPSNLSDVKKLRALIANAKRLGRSDVVLRAQIRIAELAGLASVDPIEAAFWRAVTITEEFLSEQRGKTTRLSRTRQKHQRVGARQCLIDWANDPKPTEGFKLLIEEGKPELTGEGIVLKYACEFDAETVCAAQRKLTEYGVRIEQCLKDVRA